MRVVGDQSATMVDPDKVARGGVRVRSVKTQILSEVSRPRHRRADVAARGQVEVYRPLISAEVSAAEVRAATGNPTHDARIMFDASGPRKLKAVGRCQC